MSKTWKSEFETGEEAIDAHHRELFHLDSLLDQAIRSRDEEKLEEILRFLETYVVAHFEEEEELMKREGYGGYAHHRQEHEIFKARVALLRRTFGSGPSKTHLILSIRMFIDQLVDHIKTVDIGLNEISRVRKSGKFQRVL
jgi:hemerythrin